MPQPMLKESPPPEAQESRPRRRMSPPTPEMLARARELEKELGHPLRTEIAWPLTEKEEEEVIIARSISEEEWIPAEEFFKKHGLD